MSRGGVPGFESSEGPRGPEAARSSLLRRVIQILALAIAVLGGAWTLYLVDAGGFDARIFGRRITTHEPLRPLLFTSLALTLFILSDGVVRVRLGWIRALGRIDERIAIGALAGLTFLLSYAYATTAASGADAYGYVSQADLWIEGKLKIDQPWVAGAPWPSKRWSFAPLGYRPLEEEGQWAIVPTYSPGLPLLMAAAKLIGGQCALYLVVPLSGALLVLATYGLGRRLGAPRQAGLIAAWLVVTSPTVMFMIMWPMTDVPVAAAWSLAFYFLFGQTTRSAAAAGAAATIAILIRPNLVFLVIPMALWYLLRAWRAGPDRRRQHLLNAVVFGACAGVGVVAVAAINRHLYGSATTSGYGGLGDMFQQANILPNFKNYVSWFIESQTAIPLLGFVALVVPLRRFWPGVRDRSMFVVMGLAVLGLWFQYLVYIVFEAWWYLRFLLMSWPFIMLGLASAALGLVPASRPRLRVAVVLALVGLGLRDLRLGIQQSAFEVWQGERRYVSAGKLVRSVTESNSVIFSMQHSGSLRYYAGRMTLRFDNLDDDWLDRAVGWLAERGVRSYLLAEDWEIPDFKRRFASQRTVAQLQMPPIFMYKGPATILLYDLQKPRDPKAEVDTIVETFENLRCVPPAPKPTLSLK